VGWWIWHQGASQTDPASGSSPLPSSGPAGSGGPACHSNNSARYAVRVVTRGFSRAVLPQPDRLRGHAQLLGRSAARHRRGFADLPPHRWGG
jgi:hypothetical protein